ncbi:MULTISPECIES: hypothetical protein [Sporolactobacillus]|uniref:DUF4083 domain-containing protein n=3 Tax=Sporolactobacillus TaxID=2077 RepID=A0A4Y1Z8S4_9BACL|nr:MULTISPECIES: hypothetical protein [Sporolactobacillus]KLI02232.1 hypothetical protein SINU_09100 [Sporolactobacillus inulinus CASD]QAA23171.1 Na(+)-translocating NADH-quinone reductase subunit C [Sporolactobacillus terrae]QAA26141.1 Na(+)-translocating NADH-quinone reductase subunit C [Sporolactobacillus terrae]UAK15237.1 hypothetical protein K7399_09010 [Sporolactobacillus terrae]GAY75385.1 hypothetical protein NBRC111894_939 [Sporolactobacillus inulinus]
MLSFSLGTVIFQLIITLILVALSIFIVAFLVKYLVISLPKRRNKEILDKLDEISKKLDQRK